jgi:hypothetical protein
MDGYKYKYDTLINRQNEKKTGRDLRRQWRDRQAEGKTQS